jgi:hypothetical protein
MPQKLNAAIENIRIPREMRKLPLTDTGYPVPWFAEYIRGRDGIARPELRAISRRKIVRAVTKKTCWLCGEPLHERFAFVIGPMCTVNRISAEPPSHRLCARYAVRACPFLSKPKMRRNETGEDFQEMKMAPPGIALQHNPGTCAIWMTDSYEYMTTVELIRIGDPGEVTWWHRGRNATRAEVLEAMQIGLPKLMAMAEEEGEAAVAEIKVQIAEAERYLPA